jgi:gliding motility-associated-like protein
MRNIQNITIKNLTIILFVLFAPILAIGQVPETVVVDRSNTSSQRGLCLDQNAGKVTLNYQGNKSNDKRFLCKNDKVIVTPSAWDLSGDPVNTTAPGIGYAFYDCFPKVNGNNLQDIQFDNCLNHKTPLSNGAKQKDSLWIAFSNNKTTFVDTFANDCSLQKLFKNGKPVEFWFAPITVDDYATRGYEQNGPCVKVSKDEAFNLVYLNPIEISNFKYINTGSASFTLTGGFPEYDTAGTYVITIRKDKASGIVGTVVSGPAKQGSIVTFTVPSDGTYIINITDSKSCGTQIKKDFPYISFCAENKIVAVGDKVCVDFTVDNFVDITTFEFSIKYDTTVLKLDTTGSKPWGMIGIPILPANKYNLNKILNEIIITKDPTTDNNTVLTLPNGSKLFSFCFTAIGPFGSVSPITILLNDLNSDLATDLNNKSLGINTKNGSVSIGKIPLEVAVRADSVRCSNTPNTGSLNIVVTKGGVPPYTYSYINTGNLPVNGSGNISVIGGIGATALNLPTGNYSITVTDNVGEKVISTVTIYSPPPLILNFITTDPICFSDKNGKVKINNKGGGTPPYSIKWNTGSTADSLINIPGGTYSVTLTDAKGCQSVAQQSIGANPIILNNRIITNATCKGSKNGKILVDASGGTAANGYTFEWSTLKKDLNKSGSQITSLEPGFYYLTVTDDKGCTLVDTFNLIPSKIIKINANVRDITCFGIKNGFINVTASTIGTQNIPFAFNWSANAGPPNNTAITSIISNRDKGTYTLKVIDKDNCEADTVFIIKEPDSIKIVPTIQNLKCDGTLGNISLNVTGGTPYTIRNYDYKWSNAIGNNSPVNANLMAGTYSVTITDSLSCSKISTFNVTIPKTPTIDSFKITKPKCATSTDAIVEVFAKQGNSPIQSYTWNGGKIGKTIAGIGTGTYYLTITATDGCLKIDSVKVTGPAPLVLVDTIKKLPLCAGDEDGGINFKVTGGTSPYTYTVGNNPSSIFPVITGFKAGTYTYSIKDANNCPALTGSFTIDDPVKVKVDIIVEKLASCYSGGPCDARVRALASGGYAGTGIYSFTWGKPITIFSSTGTISIANNLCKGFILLNVNDGICGLDSLIEIGSPDSITIDPVSLGNIKPVSCFGSADGTVDVSFLGGTPPFKYLWDNNSTVLKRDNMKAGKYSLIVSDNNNCIQTYSPIVSQPPVLKILLDSVNTRDVRCFGFSTGQIKVAVVGGNGEPYNYKWDKNPSISSIANDLSLGTYSVTVTDPKGCKDTLNYFINEPGKIFTNFKKPALPRCNNETTVVKVDSAYGGTGKSQFVYTVDFGTTLPIGIESGQLYAGPHVISIIETQTGCSIDTTIFIDEPDAIIVNLGNDVIVGLGDSLLLTPIILSSALPIDSVVWTPLTSLSLTNDPLKVYTSPLDDILYTLTVYDLNKCSGSDQILVELERNRNVFIPNIFTPNDDNNNDLFFPQTGIGVSKVNYLNVYDRWGNHLYSAGNISQGDAGIGWDGTFKGKDMNPGVYVYVMEVAFIDGTKLLYRGDITLVR